MGDGSCDICACGGRQSLSFLSWGHVWCDQSIAHYHFTTDWEDEKRWFFIERSLNLVGGQGRGEVGGAGGSGAGGGRGTEDGGIVDTLIDVLEVLAGEIHALEKSGLRSEVLVVLGRHHDERTDSERLALSLGGALQSGAVGGLLGGLLGDIGKVHLDTGKTGEAPGGDAVHLGVDTVGDVVERHGEVGGELEKDLLISGSKIHNAGRTAGLRTEEPVTSVLGIVVLDKGVAENDHKVLHAIGELVEGEVAPVEVVEKVVVTLGGDGRLVTEGVHLSEGVGLGDQAGSVGAHGFQGSVKIGAVVRIDQGRPRGRIGRVSLGGHHGLHRRVDGGSDGSRVGKKHRGSDFLETNVKTLVAEV